MRALTLTLSLVVALTSTSAFAYKYRPAPAPKGAKVVARKVGRGLARAGVVAAGLLAIAAGSTMHAVDRGRANALAMAGVNTLALPLRKNMTEGLGQTLLLTGAAAGGGFILGSSPEAAYLQQVLAVFVAGGAS